MYYEINVSLRGTHFFATAERSITDSIKLLKVYNQIAAKFTKDEGFELSVTKWENRGIVVDMQKLING